LSSALGAMRGANRGLRRALEWRSLTSHARGLIGPDSRRADVTPG
jgi:hypothetical protein